MMQVPQYGLALLGTEEPFALYDSAEEAWQDQARMGGLVVKRPTTAARWAPILERPVQSGQH